MSFCMNRASAVSLLLAACGVVPIENVCAAQASAPFGVNLIDCGGIPGGSLGSPITWSPANLAFNPGTGSNFPPSPEAIYGNPALGVDSYVAIDPVGPSIETSDINPAEGYQSLGPTNLLNPAATPTTPFGPGSLSGIWFSAGANGGFVSSTNLIFQRHYLMIAQVTLRPGTSEPTTAGLLVNIKDGGTLNPDGELGAIRFGEANASDNAGKWGQAYYLQAVARDAFGATGAFVGGTTYTIYVVAVPAPEAASLLALLGAVSLRCRRA